MDVLCFKNIKRIIMIRVRGFEKISLNIFADNILFNDVKEIYEKIKLPKRSTKSSAGYDIFSPIPFILQAGEEITLPLGFKVYMPEDEFFMIVPRSGLGFKYYTRLANTVGIIDSDYYGNTKNDGHCMAKIRNESSDKTICIEEGDAIAQGIFLKYLLADNDAANSERVGGFGSTDK
jgi:dUTP pyrophosphatase